MDSANFSHGSGPTPDDPLLASPLFDAAYYGGLAGVDGTRAGLLAHYLAEGEARELSPSDAFEVGLYAFLNPDVARYDGSLLRHYATYGRAEHRYATRAALAADARAVEESGLFDASAFACHLGRLPRAGLSLAEEYLAARDGNAPIGPAFDGGFYRDAYPDVQDHPGLPVLHYIRIGRAERRLATSAELNEHMAGCRTSFHEVFYRAQLLPGEQPDDALRHYFLKGVRRGLDPAPDFRTPTTGDPIRTSGRGAWNRSPTSQDGAEARDVWASPTSTP